MASGVRQTWVQISAPTFSKCVTLVILINSSKLQFYCGMMVIPKYRIFVINRLTNACLISIVPILVSERFLLF